MKNRSVPTDTILPHVAYRDVAAACAWLTRVFGFRENYRYGMPIGGAQMFLGNGYLMISGAGARMKAPAQVGCATQMLTVFVPDVKAHYGRVKESGAKICEELHETIYGEMQYAAEDLDGHRWLFSQHVRDVDPADWGAILAPR